jgi:hypothetical protein
LTLIENVLAKFWPSENALAKFWPSENALAKFWLSENVFFIVARRITKPGQVFYQMTNIFLGTFQAWFLLTVFFFDQKLVDIGTRERYWVSGIFVSIDSGQLRTLGYVVSNRGIKLFVGTGENVSYLSFYQSFLVLYWLVVPPEMSIVKQNFIGRQIFGTFSAVF